MALNRALDITEISHELFEGSEDVIISMITCILSFGNFTSNSSTKDIPRMTSYLDSDNT